MMYRHKKHTELVASISTNIVEDVTNVKLNTSKSPCLNTFYITLGFLAAGESVFLATFDVRFLPFRLLYDSS